MRRSLPSRLLALWAVRSGSPAPPPSPVPTWSRPSSKTSRPPLWLEANSVDREQLARAVRVGDAARGRPRPRVLDDLHGPLGVGVIDVQPSAALVVGREGEREQALLAAAADRLGDVEELLRLAAARRDPLDRSALLDHVEALGLGGGLGHVDRLLEDADPVELDPAPAVSDRGRLGSSRRLGLRGALARRVGRVATAEDGHEQAEQRDCRRPPLADPVPHVLGR